MYVFTKIFLHYWPVSWNTFLCPLYESYSVTQYESDTGIDIWHCTGIRVWVGCCWVLVLDLFAATDARPLLSAENAADCCRYFFHHCSHLLMAGQRLAKLPERVDGPGTGPGRAAYRDWSGGSAGFFRSATACSSV